MALRMSATFCFVLSLNFCIAADELPTSEKHHAFLATQNRVAQMLVRLEGWCTKYERGVTQYIQDHKVGSDYKNVKAVPFRGSTYSTSKSPTLIFLRIASDTVYLTTEEGMSFAADPGNDQVWKMAKKNNYPRYDFNSLDYNELFRIWDFHARGCPDFTNKAAARLERLCAEETLESLDLTEKARDTTYQKCILQNNLTGKYLDFFESLK